MKYYMFLVTLFICALTDIVTFRIRNMILVVSAIGLLLFDLLISPGEDPVSDLTAGGVVFIILIPFYMMGLLAAGDVKLLMVSAMYAGLASMCRITAASAVISLGVAFFISRVRKESIVKTHYPFAFALFLGAFPFWFDLF